MQLTTIQGATVLIKEARKSTGVDWNGNDATERLQKEYRLLNKLKDTNVTPKPIELFWEWEHLYLVEEFIEGPILSQFTTTNNPFVIGDSTLEKRERYTEEIVSIWRNIAISLKEIHKKGIVVGDLSITNIILNDRKSSSIKIIDLEGAWEIAVDQPETQFGTPGFKPKNLLNDTKDDIFSLGAIYLGMLCPSAVSMSQIEPDLKRNFIELSSAEIGLPIEFRNLIHECMNDIADYRPNLTSIVNRLDSHHGPDFTSNLPQSINKSELLSIVNLSLEYIIDVADYNRKDRVFPADPMVYMTNPNSIAHGASGVAYAISQLKGEVPKEVLSWILSSNLDSNSNPPGLYIGLSGIAWSLWESGMQEVSKKLLRERSFSVNMPLSSIT